MQKNPTCIFLTYIAKELSAVEKLLDICDGNGAVLLSGEDLNNYITNFYSNLYRRDNTVEGEIEDFLGPDVCQHPLVRDSILTNEEMLTLDYELSILELDKSLEQANTVKKVLRV